VDGTNSAANFDDPQGIAIDSTGVLYVADTYNNAIRKVTPIGTNWVVTTIAGLPGKSNTGSNDGSNNVARFTSPGGISVNATGTVFVADTGNHTIRRIVPSGTNWIVTTIAGQAGAPGPWDGSNNVARFNGPIALTVDNAGSFYVADFNNNTIRKGSAQGTNWVITTIAGSAIAPPGSVDGTNSNARFYQPQGIVADPSGNLYVSEAGNMGPTDFGNDTIRKIKPVGTNWIVVTVAGLAQSRGSADGIGSAARFNNPFGAAVTPSGVLFIADSWNNTIRSGQLAILLDYKLSGNKLVLSWPVAPTGFVAEASGSLGGSWIPLTGVVTNGDTLFLTNTPGPGAGFFRLHKP
jgi:sugar lactone lactonase YvrE